jgi:hypothetical protein
MGMKHPNTIAARLSFRRAPRRHTVPVGYLHIIISFSVLVIRPSPLRSGRHTHAGFWYPVCNAYDPATSVVVLG